MATITVPSDPTLPVAGAEIKAPPLKDWITNIRTFIESTSIDEGNVDTSGSDGIVGKSIAQTVTGLKTWSNVSAAAGGLREVAKFEINPASGTPAANDGLRMTFTADDAGGAATAIGYLDLKMTDASASSEDSEWRLSTIANASSVTPLVVNSTAITMTTTTVAIGTNATVGGALTVTGGGTFGSLTVGSAAISEAELEMLDGITPGTIAASKAVVVNANKDASDFRDVGARNIVLTGELDAVTLDISGDADIDGTLEADAITLGGTALGSLYSPIAGGSGIVTTGALNSGSITSGFGTIDTGSSTITTTGVVAAGGLTIGSAVIVEAELEMIDGITAGTAAASKAVVLDGSKNIATIGTIGSGAITSSGVVTATGFTIGSAVVDETELEILDGASVTTAELNLLDALDRGSIIYGNASGVTAVLGQGGDGTVLTSDGTDISWQTSTVGDITSVVAGSGMTGGATSGAATLNVIGGNGITANSDDVAITAAQTTITSIYNTSLKMGRDSQNLIDFATTDNKIILRVNNVDEVELVADTLQPTTSDGVALGTTSLMWSDLFLASGSVINFAADDVTLTHSSETLTVAGGTFAAVAITGTTIDATTDFTIGDTVITDGVITDSSGLSVASATTVASTLTVGANTDGHDVKFFGDATGSYMEWDESEEQLRILGPATDAAASSGKLLLATAQVGVASGDILGQIDFQAPLETQGGDGVEIAASIRALAQDTFTATVNKTDLIFYTGSSEAATEKFRFTSDGELGVGGANYGSDGQVLTSTGAGTAPAWESVSAGLSYPLDMHIGASMRVTVATTGSPTVFSLGWWKSGDGRWWLLGNTTSAASFARGDAEFYIPTGDIADVPSS